MSIPQNVLLVTLGTYGDLHPYLAMGRALLARGSRVTLATHAQYRDQVERQGFTFVALPPGPDELPMDEAWANLANRPIRGMEYVVKRMLLPYFDEAEARFTEAARGKDLIITHFMAFFAPAVAEALGIPWLSVAYSPTVLFSAHDPPALGVLPFLPRLRWLGPRVIGSIFDVLALPSRNWFGKIHAQRARLGLVPLITHPLFQYTSSHGTLALFPESFAQPQPDWPTRTRQLDFPLFSEGSARPLTAPLVEFLAQGDAPFVFTLGTSVGLMRTQFYDHARRAARDLGRRAVFVVGPHPPRALAHLKSDAHILVSKYENFTKLFPAAAVIVHPGGTNTTALALAAGRPQVCVPFANDQLDNARRVAKLGAGVIVPARRLDTSLLTEALRTAPQVLVNSGFSYTPTDFNGLFVRAVSELVRS